MEDDIDIEEHDVLDNPKIRDIFPDLSLVKTEVPDEDIEDQYEENQEYSLQLDYPCNIKNEVISDEENNANYDYEQNEQSTSHAYEQSEQSTSHAYEQSEQSTSHACEQSDQNALDAYEQSEQNASDAFQQSDQNTSCVYEQNLQSTSCAIQQNEQIELVPYRYQQNEQGDSNDYQFTNKIILGTKPDYDVLYQEALNSNVTVILENWELKLKNSSCFCETCEILFPTINGLDAHNSISHSFLVALDTKPNTARKSTVTTCSTYCNHCDKTFPNDTALITHLYELLPLNKFMKPPTPQTVKIDSTSVQFKCIKCKKYFANYANGKRHKKLAHPTMANVNLIVRVLNNAEKPVPLMVKKEAAKTVLSKTESDSNIIVEKEEKDTKTVLFTPSFVPKSILFQCNLCQVSFLSCYSAIQHSHKCEKKPNFQKCTICKKKIRVKDFKIHELQHKYTEKLKIYTLHRSIYEKVLLKCPKCAICFDEKTFWMHRRTCDGSESMSTRCNSCLIDITQSKYESHKYGHVTKKFTKKDFIIVEFCDTTNMSAVANQMQRKPMIRTTESDFTLYYCSHCKTYRNIFSLRGHANGACKGVKIRYCEDCGLGFSRNVFRHHRLLHHKKKISLSDFKIISIATKQQIEPPMPSFYKCNKCEKHFISKYEMKRHNCKTEPFQTCKICNKKFNSKAIDPHSNFHTVRDIPLLLKKYNSINNIWNVIYKCVMCDLVSLTYDSAVEHSQFHINGYKRPQSKLCQVCDFDIVENCYQTHMNLHKNNKNINSKQFTILKYDFRHLFDTEWMSILASLPKQHKYQILSKSIYRYSRRFKLNIEINCHTDDLKYVCKRCKTSIQPDEIKQHFFNKNCKPSNKFVCNTCSTKHTTLNECIQHENEHENLQKTYKVITFNDQKDALFDQRLKNYELKTNKLIKTNEINKSAKKITANKKSAIKIAINKKNAIKMATKKGLIYKPFKQSVRCETERYNRIKLYKCEKCNSCLSLKKNLINHSCAVAERRKKLCNICKEYLNSTHLIAHLKIHKSMPKLPKKPLIIYFNPNNISLPIAVVFQCDCGLHFTSKQSIEKHLNLCSDGLEISKEMCSKCNLLFPTEVLVTHLCKHHSKPVDIKIQKFQKTEKGPYLCANCNVVYFTVSSFEDHLFKCPTKLPKLCQTCNHNFDRKTYATHPCVIDQEMTVIKNTAAVAKMYRCHTCNITYLFRKSYDYHIEVGHVSRREIHTCNICKLRFTGQILIKHMSMHDPNEKYIIKVYEPETGNSSIIKGRNFKLDCVNKSPKRKDSALNTSKKAAKSPKKSIENVDQTMSPKKSTKVIDQRMSAQVPEKVTDQNTPSDSDSVTVYRCNSCDICYLYKKRIDYHLEMNHITKRVVKPCSICGLRFSQHILRQHEPIHAKGDKYTINIIELEGDNTILAGKNKKPDTKNFTSKRRTRLNYDSALSKKAKIDSENFADEIDDDKVSDQNRKKFADQEPSTSKFDFESVNMNLEQNQTTASDLEADITEIDNCKDPLNNSLDINLPDVSNNSVLDNTHDKSFVSDKIKNILNATFDKYSNNLYKCFKCKLHFMTEQSMYYHLKRTNHKIKIVSVNCDICGLVFTPRSLPRHVYVHHTTMNINQERLFNIIDLFANENKAKLKNDSLDTVAAEKKNKKNDFYKCADCNVCFIDEASCRKHMSNHIHLDPMTYIECKICNFQFLIDSLKEHMNLHHSTEFNLEDVVVKEFKETGDRQPKIDVYRGIDKVQSRLVSTTTDVAVDSTGDV